MSGRLVTENLPQIAAAERLEGFPLMITHGTYDYVLLVDNGRKARDYFRRRNFRITGEHLDIIDRPTIEQGREIAGKLIEAYSKAEIDAVYLAVNEFKSVMAPEIVLRKILPVEVPVDTTIVGIEGELQVNRTKRNEI